jgi:hypothetical protein
MEGGATAATPQPVCPARQQSHAYKLSYALPPIMCSTNMAENTVLLLLLYSYYNYQLSGVHAHYQM